MSRIKDCRLDFEYAVGCEQGRFSSPYGSPFLRGDFRRIVVFALGEIVRAANVSSRTTEADKKRATYRTIQYSTVQ